MTPSTSPLRTLSAISLLLAACGARADDAPPAEPPSVVIHEGEFAVAAEHELSTGPTFSGALAPRHQATLRAELAGIVTALTVEEGRRVAAGQVLLRLDDSAIRDALLSAQSGVRTAREALTLAQRNAERAERLTAVGAMAERELESAHLQVTSAEGSLADALAREASARKQVDKTMLRAPFAGVVSERHVHVGDVTTVGAMLVSMVDPSELQLEANVPVAALGALEVGAPVDFRIGGFGADDFTGRIETINPVADPATRQVRVLVTIPNREHRLVANLFAEGRVTTARRTVLAIPADAVDHTGASPVVRRIHNGLVELVAVALGVVDDVRGLVELRGGLVAGDTILTGQAMTLATGTPVQLVQE